MIKKCFLFIALTSLLILSSCSPGLSSSFTKEGYTENTYKKIAVVGISKDLISRMSFEKTIVSELKENGINAIEGITMFPQNMNGEKSSPATLKKIVLDNKLDGVISVSLVRKEDGHKYQPGGTYTVPTGYYRFGRYVSRQYVTVREPGYYEPSKSYVIEAVLYNLKGQLTSEQDNWVWTGQTSLVDPSSLESASETFSKKLVAQILKDKVITTQAQD